MNFFLNFSSHLLTLLFQAVVDNNLVLVRLLHIHGADINRPDSDTWTPLHAAAANGFHTIVSYLLSHGADRNKKTEDGETAEDLVEEDDFTTMAVFKNTKEEVEKLRRLSAITVVDRSQERKEPAWVRRMSLQEAAAAARRLSVKENSDQETGERRKGSTWVGKEEIPEEEESETETELESANKDSEVSDKKNVPQATKISTTTILVSKDKDDVSKLNEDPGSKMKEGCNSKSKEDCGAKTTRQRRQGRLELNLETNNSQFLTVNTNHQTAKPPAPTIVIKEEKKSSDETKIPSVPSSKSLVSLKVSEIESMTVKISDKSTIKASDSKQR